MAAAPSATTCSNRPFPPGSPIMSDGRSGLAGRHAIVVGGAQGIGRCCARSLHQAGAEVTIADINAELVEATASELSDGGASVGSAVVDITDPESCARLVSDATDGERLPPELLVNCASLYREAAPLEQDPNDWSQVLHAGLNGAFFVSQAFARRLVTAGRPGRIVHISSVSSTHAMAGLAAYGTAKAGMDALVRALALDWGRYGICVNAVAPSHVATERIRFLEASGELAVDRIVARIPLGRLAEEDEVADAVMFLLSEQAAFITGAVLNVDGGYSANGDFNDAPT